MPISVTGERTWITSARRMWDYALHGRDNGAPNLPLVKNNESILAMNAAGTSTVALIKANASDVAELASGIVIPAATFNDANALNRFIPISTAKTIVDGSATSLFDVACASGARCGGTLFYHVFASDGTDHQAMTGLVSYSAVNKAATLTLTITNATANDAKAVSSGTITLAWTFVTGTGKGTIKLQPTGSLTETVYNVTCTIFPIVGAVTVL